LEAGSGEGRPVYRASSTPQPLYPVKAHASGIEGQVKARFDISETGDVNNVVSLSARPANVSEGEVCRALNNWRYESGHAGKGIIVSIGFHHQEMDN